MAGEADRIQCPFCGRELEDSRDPSIHCKYCGKNFRRVDVFNEDEKMMRQNMIIDLSTYMSKLKITKNVAGLMGVLCIVGFVVILFAEEMALILWIMLAAFVAGAVFWAVLWFINSKKYTQNQSKLFDLSGGRRVD